MMTTGNSLAVGQSSQAGFVISGHSQTAPATEGFVDRRAEAAQVPATAERRQFGNSHLGLSDDGRELALAIDRYKLENHRRYLTCDEMIQVLSELGYKKTF
jgi:hypothetical protein